MINIIVAHNYKRIIGKDGKIPWHIPTDLKRFQEITMGHPIIMGRRTHESIGRVLEGRVNIVISSNRDYIPPKLPGEDEQLFVATSLEQAIDFAASRDKEIFVIGGEQVYSDILPWASRIYLTFVKNNADGDTIFPQLDAKEWEELSCQKGKVCDFVVLNRREKK